MKHIQFIIINCLILILFSSCNTKEITPLRGKVKFELVSISSKLAGRIEKIYIEEGQHVKKGDTLAYINIPEVNAKLAQVEGVIMSAKGQLNMAYNGATTDQLNQINGKLEAGKAQLKFAKESFNRMKAMYKDSLISQQQFDEVKMKYESAKGQISALKAKKDEIVKGTRAEQIEQAKGQLNQAKGVKAEVLVASKEKYLIAPVNMSIETISLKEGELVTPGYTIVNGYQENKVYFRFTVTESEVYNYEVGQEIMLVNPYTKQEFTAKIVTIKQLAKYADVTTTAPKYELSEATYELKLVPTTDVSKNKFYTNATVLIKQ